MKNIFIVCFLLVSGIVLAQDQERKMIEGIISVPPDDDPTGITIFNSETKTGTVSNPDGEFAIEVAPGDRLHFSAVQFHNFTVIIGEGVMDSGQLNVTISEAINELPEVVVRPYDLTGNVRVDVKRIPVNQVDLPEVSAAELKRSELVLPSDEATAAENAAMDLEHLEHGLNFVNIFKAIFSERQRETVDRKMLDEKVRDLYNDEFFVTYLDIKRENINDFILFAEENGLTRERFQQGNEFDLIQFLIEQSENYKQQ